MRRAVCTAALVLAALAAAGVLLYRHFVTDRIMDGGDMENPFREAAQAEPVLPDGGELVSLTWLQNAMCFDDSYRFALSGGADAAALSCSFSDPDAPGARLELGGDDPDAGVPVSRAQWEQVVLALQALCLPEYQPPDPDLSDAAVNQLSITRQGADGAALCADYDGADAEALFSLLCRIAREAAAQTLP